MRDSFMPSLRLGRRLALSAAVAALCAGMSAPVAAQQKFVSIGTGGVTGV